MSFDLVKYTLNENIEIVIGDLRDRDFCLKVVENIDIICHFAGSGHGHLLTKYKKNSIELNAFNNNLISTVNLYNACIKSNTIEKIVQLSSAAIYGDKDTSATENDFPSPCSPYAISKMCQEYFSNVYKLLGNLNIVTFRCFNIYGYNKNIEAVNSNIVHKYIYLIKNLKTPLIIGNPFYKRDYVYIDDISEAIIKVLYSNGADGHTINLGTGSSTSLAELIDLINLQLGSKIEYVCINREYLNISYSEASIKKCFDLLNYSCSTTLIEGIQLINNKIL